MMYSKNTVHVETQWDIFGKLYHKCFRCFLDKTESTRQVSSTLIALHFAVDRHYATFHSTVFALLF